MGKTEDDKAPPKKVRTMRKKRRIKPKNYPKRPLSAYNVFFKETREAIIAARKDSKEEAANRDHKVDFQEMAKEIASRWKNLGESERERVEGISKEDMTRYREEVKAFEEVEAARKKKEEEEAEAAAAEQKEQAAQQVAIIKEAARKAALPSEGFVDDSVAGRANGFLPGRLSTLEGLQRGLPDGLAAGLGLGESAHLQQLLLQQQGIGLPGAVAGLQEQRQMIQQQLLFEELRAAELRELQFRQLQSLEMLQRDSLLGLQGGANLGGAGGFPQSLFAQQAALLGAQQQQISPADILASRLETHAPLSSTAGMFNTSSRGPSALGALAGLSASQLATLTQSGLLKPGALSPENGPVEKVGEDYAGQK